MTEEPVGIPRIKVRIEGLSDIVFGLALSIGSLALISNLPSSPEIFAGDIVLFVFSFMLVVISWFFYTRVLSVLPVEVGGALVLNVVLLLCVALEPYTLYVLQTTQTVALLTWSSFAYAVDVGLIYLVLGGLANILVKEAKRPGTELKVHPIIVRRMRHTMQAQLFVAGVFLVSALPFFWVVYDGSYLRFDLWYLSIGVVFIWLATRRRAEKA